MFYSLILTRLQTMDHHRWGHLVRDRRMRQQAVSSCELGKQE